MAIPAQREIPESGLNGQAVPPAYARRRFYIPVFVKFAFSTAAAAWWLGFSAALAQPWIGELGSVVGLPAAWIIVTFVALVPGFLNAQLTVSLLLDTPPPLNLNVAYPPVTVLIAAYNEAKALRESFRGLGRQDYPAPVEIIVVDDGSTDRTRKVLDNLKIRYRNLRVIAARHSGKARALNLGLAAVTTDIVVTIDADTFLQRQGLRRIVGRLLTDPPHTAAVAGTVLAKNSRQTGITRLQEWDYFLAIASVKRQQSLYQGTLVAQGAFSAFKTAALREVSGWPSLIGEDIVVTWALQKRGHRIGFEPTACGFTLVPWSWRGFNRQRQRWARGMIEGLKTHGDLIWKRPRLSGFFVAIDLLFPLLDATYSLVFLPGVILAFFGHYWIAGPMTLFVIPLVLTVALVMFSKQRKVFRELGLRIRRNYLGFAGWLVVYQFLMSPVATLGYLRELVGAKKRW